MCGIESVFEGVGRTGFCSIRCACNRGERIGCERGHKHLNSWLRLELDALHPDDATLHLEDRPHETCASGNLHVFKDFLYLAGAAGVVDSDPVARQPRAEDRGLLDVCPRWVSRGKLDPQEQAEGWRLDNAGDGEAEFRCNFRTVCSRGTCRLGGEAQLAMGAFGAKTLSQLEFLTGASVDGKSSQGCGGGEIERGAKGRGGMAKQPALESRRQFCEAHDVESEAIGCGASAAAHGTTAQDDLRGEPFDLGLPRGFFIARELGHLCEMLAEPRIPGLKERQQLVADAIARKGEMAIGGVFAPGLVQRAEIDFDFGTRRPKKRSQDAALWKFEDGMDAGEPVGPCAAKELGQDGFGLVVEGVGGGHCVKRNVGQEFSEPCAAKAACGLFDGLGGLAGGWVRFCFGGGVDAGIVERQIEAGGQDAHKFQIRVGFSSTQAMVEMGDVKDKAQFPPRLTILLRERSQQGD